MGRFGQGLGRTWGAGSARKCFLPADLRKLVLSDRACSASHAEMHTVRRFSGLVALSPRNGILDGLLAAIILCRGKFCFTVGRSWFPPLNLVLLHSRKVTVSLANPTPANPNQTTSQRDPIPAKPHPRETLSQRNPVLVRTQPSTFDPVQK